MPARDAAANAEFPETPAFKAAVEAAVQSAIAALLPTLTEGRDVGDGNAALVKMLALEIAKINGQGSGRKYVDPAVLEERESAMKELEALLSDFSERGIVPSYRLIEKTQLPTGRFGHVVFNPLHRNAAKQVEPVEIDCPLMPNLAMEPIDDNARRVFTLFRKAVGAELPHGHDTSAMALSQNGVVLRGRAAETMLRNDPAARDSGGVVVRRGEDVGVRQVQLLGTLTKPVEMK